LLHHGHLVVEGSTLVSCETIVVIVHHRHHASHAHSLLSLLSELLLDAPSLSGCASHPHAAHSWVHHACVEHSVSLGVSVAHGVPKHAHVAHLCVRVPSSAICVHHHYLLLC
jgi:small ligand-binding sensory domain FIST